MTEQEAGFEKRYLPNAVSRRSEVVSWGIALLLIGVAAVFQVQSQSVPTAISILAIFFFLASIVISFGNWMERSTFMVVGEDRIYYQNGVRKVALGWNEIKEIELREDRLGKKITILAEAGHFQFRLLSAPRFEGEVRSEFGFQPADEIMREITSRTGLEPKKIVEGKG